MSLSECLVDLVLFSTPRFKRGESLRFEVGVLRVRKAQVKNAVDSRHKPLVGGKGEA
jgi:hypothetical protein